MEFLFAHWLELIGVASGLICVWLLARENVLTFPVGLGYSLVTVYVVAQANLYADVLLNLYYVVMNAYGWFYWLRGAQAQRLAGRLVPQNLDRALAISLVVIILVGSVLMGLMFDRFSQADFAFADSFTTVASFVAMWMTARKYLASWIAWFVIDVVQIVVYLLKGAQDPGLYLYAGLYTVYLAMAVMGWRSWRLSQQQAQLA